MSMWAMIQQKQRAEARKRLRLARTHTEKAELVCMEDAGLQQLVGPINLVKQLLEKLLKEFEEAA